VQAVDFAHTLERTRLAHPLPAGAQVLGLRLNTTYSTSWDSSNPAIGGEYVRLNGVDIGELGWVAVGTGNAFLPLERSYLGAVPAYLPGASNALLLGSAWNPVTLGPVTLTITYGLLEPTDHVSGWQLQAALTGAQAGDHLSLLPVEGLTIGESTVTERGVTVATISRASATFGSEYLLTANPYAVPPGVSSRRTPLIIATGSAQSQEFFHVGFARAADV
jgi:hypothetical protein